MISAQWVKDVFIDAGLPVLDVSVTITNDITITYTRSLTAPEQTTVANLLASNDEASYEIQSIRIQSRKLLNKLKDFVATVIRSEIMLTVDELNDIRTWLRTFKTQTAASGTFAAFKTNVAGLPNMTNRTYIQAREAMENKMNNGDADT